jgi:RimJ/RimL family protein N-acetyltransferase
MKLDEVSFLTSRLRLRELRLTDAKAMLKYRSNPQIYKFQNFNPQTLEEVENFIGSKIAKEMNVLGTWYQLGICIKETDELIGDIGIHFIDDDNLQVEIGYSLSVEYQGRGYATEAVTEVINYLFSKLNKHRITASIDPRNLKSKALLERIGMRKEAHFKKNIFEKGEWTDDVIYAILEEEWFAMGNIDKPFSSKEGSNEQ